MTAQQPVYEARGISKRYGNVIALDDVERADWGVSRSAVFTHVGGTHLQPACSQTRMASSVATTLWEGPSDSLRPGEDWSGSERFEGQEGLGLGDGTGVLQDIADLDALADQLSQSHQGAALDDIDLDALGRQLGQDAAVDARTLSELEKALRDSGLLHRGSDGALRLSPRAVRQLGRALLRDYFASKNVAMQPQQSAGFTALNIVLPLPPGWSHVPDPNVPDAFAVIADRVGGELAWELAATRLDRFIGLVVVDDEHNTPYRGGGCGLVIHNDIGDQDGSPWSSNWVTLRVTVLHHPENSIPLFEDPGAAP